MFSEENDGDARCGLEWLSTGQAIWQQVVCAQWEGDGVCGR